MKTYNNLFKSIVSFENLLAAAKKAQAGKRSNHDVARFNTELEKELIQLQKELSAETYQPGPYRSFTIYEPKKRRISAAPFRDRVVHHALCNVIEPIFEKTFIYDSYANRKNKGTHKAIKRYQRFSRNNSYVLKCDIKKYFPSIDHEILKKEMRWKIACQPTLRLIDKIIDNSNTQEPIFDYFPGDNLFTPSERRKGLPIGNLTSQFFANVYLNKLDHFTKEQLKCRYYIRYVDDFIVMDNDKARLRTIKNEVETFLAQYRIKLNKTKSRIFQVTEGVEFLGFRIFPYFKLLKKQNKIRFKRKLRKYQSKYNRGGISQEKIKRSLQGWIAHASFGNTYRLREKIAENFILTMG